MKAHKSVVVSLVYEAPTLLVGVVWLVGLLASVWGAVIFALHFALSRFPLCIDPQMQAVLWIKKKEGRALEGKIKKNIAQ